MIELLTLFKIQHPLMRRSFGRILLICILITTGITMPSGAYSKPPNIVFILVDDLGWSDLGCYGNGFMETPAIDRMASEGMRFTSAYTSPVCAPSRGQILSGLYSARTGWYKVPFRGNDRPWAKVVPPENWFDSLWNARPVAALLTGGGYESALVGKEHVPDDLMAGFEGKTDKEKARAALGDAFYGKVVAFSEENPGKQVGPITRQAIEFIASNKEKPFFCYIGHHIPHIPLEAREELIQKHEAKWQDTEVRIHPHYAAMCEVMDESVGLIDETLRKLGVAGNTVVVFFSDNGGVNRCFYDGKGEQITDLSPLRGEKGGIYEGGIRVPFIVRWPGKVKPGGVSDIPVVSTDLLPTFAEMAGVPLPEGQLCDGESLVGIMKQQSGLQRKEIFTYFPDYHHDFPGSAVRQGDYKLIQASEDGHLELYNLAEDTGEQHNLAEEMPGKADILNRILEKWMEELGAKQAMPNPDYDPLKKDLLDPEAEQQRRSYLPEELKRNVQ
jgi:uncharacterized sulfatase